jgi:hypothetical protein
MLSSPNSMNFKRKSKQMKWKKQTPTNSSAQVKQTMFSDFHFLMIFLKIVTSNELFGLTFWCLGFLWTEKLKPNYKGKNIFMGRSQFCFTFFWISFIIFLFHPLSFPFFII